MRERVLAEEAGGGDPELEAVVRRLVVEDGARVDGVGVLRHEPGAPAREVVHLVRDDGGRVRGRPEEERAQRARRR